jgi:tRNA nucleotidyltransferase (CCA-adding enzyme)
VDDPGSIERVTPPPGVVRIVERLERAGHEAWCVGGAVRDALLGHGHLDWDIATSARPEQVQRIFRRTVPVGVEFGTVGVFDGTGVLHEVTTFRRDVRTDGRHAVVEFGVSLDDDLARRDFTINAMAFSPTQRRLHDPYHGRADLRDRIVRAVGVAERRMAEDRLRALRGIRFAARFGFELHPDTWRAIVSSAPHLNRLSAERVRQEIDKTLEQVARPSRAFALWKESGAFATLVPLLERAPLDRFHVADALPQPGLPQKSARAVLRLASLFVGDSTADVRSTLRALRFSNDTQSVVCRVLDGLRAVADDMRGVLSREVPSARQIRPWVASIGRTDWVLVMRLLAAVWKAECASGGMAPSAHATRELYRGGIRIAFTDAIAVGDLAVDGDDLHVAGVPAGPEIGRALRALLRIVIDDPSKNTRSALLEIAEREFGRARPPSRTTG